MIRQQSTRVSDELGAAQQRLGLSDFSIFYEFSDGQLLRRMQPLELAYARTGPGEMTVMCFHSLSAASSTFTGFAEALHDRAELVTLDLRGFGDSNRPTHSYSVELWADDASKLLAEISPGSPPIVYGHGLGACVALALAGRETVGAVVVSGVALAPGEPVALSEVVAAGERGETVAGILHELTEAPTSVVDLTPQIVARAAQAWQTFDGRPLAESLAVPLLVLATDDDRLTPADAEGGAAWCAAAAGAPLVSLPGGHELPVTQPGAVAWALLNWLNKRKG